jgi:hypothetical protein
MYVSLFFAPAMSTAKTSSTWQLVLDQPSELFIYIVGKPHYRLLPTIRRPVCKQEYRLGPNYLVRNNSRVQTCNSSGDAASQLMNGSYLDALLANDFTGLLSALTT